MVASEDIDDSGWRAIGALIWPHRRRFLMVAVFAILATATDLWAPLIYREAVNDIAGVFVRSASRPDAVLLGITEPDVQVQAANNNNVVKPAREPHRRGHVAPRTAEQTF